MTIRDEQMWLMPKLCADAVAEVAPAQRVFLKQLMGTLDEQGADPNDVVSFAAEVLAAQVNLVAERLLARRAEVAPYRPTLSVDDVANIFVSDVYNRAQMRRFRGDDT